MTSALSVTASVEISAEVHCCTIEQYMVHILHTNAKPAACVWKTASDLRRKGWALPKVDMR
jgi:hypothetical protein